jgi:hypothetical protein
MFSRNAFRSKMKLGNNREGRQARTDKVGFRIWKASETESSQKRNSGLGWERT